MKIPFISFLIFFTTTLTGQVRFDFLVGMNVSSFSTDLMEDYGFEVYRELYISQGGSATSEAKNSVRTGFYLAAEADLFISEKSFLKSGLKYTTLGDSYFFKTDDVVFRSSTGSESDEKYKFRPRLDYLAIPVNYGLQLSEYITIQAGVTAQFTLNNALRANYYEPGKNDSVKQKWENTEDVVEASSFVPFGNLGISYYANQLVFDLRYNQSLASVYDDPAFEGTTAQFNDTNLWNIEIGMGFVLN